MPELPEVETIRQQLKALIIGRKIIDIKVLYPPIVKIDLDEFKKRLIQEEIMDLDRYGKYLIFKFKEDALVSHLRMEGKYYIRLSLRELTKHDHIIFFLDNGRYLTYHDVRKFGTMELVKKDHVFDLKSIGKLGPEANDPSLNPKAIYKKIKASSRPIKSLLLDQTIVCGLGNIYVDETLFLSQIHPEKKGHSLRFKDVLYLLDNARKVLKKAIALGGTTIRTYHSTFGIDGLFQNELNVHTKKGQACPICQDTILKIRVGGRGTYYCPNCQKRGK